MGQPIHAEHDTKVSRIVVLIENRWRDHPSLSLCELMDKALLRGGVDWEKLGEVSDEELEEAFRKLPVSLGHFGKRR
jgi:hypothetical protein